MNTKNAERYLARALKRNDCVEISDGKWFHIVAIESLDTDEVRVTFADGVTCCLDGGLILAVVRSENPFDNKVSQDTAYRLTLHDLWNAYHARSGYDTVSAVYGALRTLGVPEDTAHNNVMWLFYLNHV